MNNNSEEIIKVELNGDFINEPFVGNIYKLSSSGKQKLREYLVDIVYRVEKSIRYGDEEDVVSINNLIEEKKI